MTPTSPDFYRAFEDRFRGSRESIKSRLSVYAPLLTALSAHTTARVAIDLGCGRGEWLELLTEMGFEASGSDLDAGMLSNCHDLNLNVQQRDALETLKYTPSNSVALVSAFHLVEHLPFDRVIELIEQAHRVLVPGGLIMMETPNSENIGVGTWNFYLDPTHERPIPHLLLEFATKFGGFEFAQVVRVNEDPNLQATEEVSLLDVLCRASPDYAIIGVKARADQKTVEEVFGGFLSHHHGLTLEALANRFDEKYSGAIRALDAELFALRAQFTSFQDFELKLLQQFSNDTGAHSERSLETFAHAKQTLVNRLDMIEQQFQAQVQRQTDEQAKLVDRFEALVQQQSLERAALAQQLHDVHMSTSWRLTKPLRLLVSGLKRIKRALSRSR